MAKTAKQILITGDVVCDRDFYCGNRFTADSEESRGLVAKITAGGSRLIRELVNVVQKSTDWDVEFGLDVDVDKLPLQYHAYCYWEPELYDPDDKEPPRMVWRGVPPILGYGPKDETSKTSPWKPITPSAEPQIVVIDDAGLTFRHAESKDSWPNFLKKGNHLPWIVLKLSGEIGKGELWKSLTKDKADKLVVIIAADVLRAGSVKISRGMSWEATVEDLIPELQNNIRLSPLLEAAHIIVTFRFDGAIWIQTKKDKKTGLRKIGASRLIFDGKYAEREWESRHGNGNVFGLQTCFTAAVVREVCKWEDLTSAKKKSHPSPDFEGALISGLSACRELRKIGHGFVDDKKGPGFPMEEVAKRIIDPVPKPEADPKGGLKSPPKTPFASATIPTEFRPRGEWQLLGEVQMDQNQPRPHYDFAMALAKKGAGALAMFPVAKFGGLWTVDRAEIESLRAIRHVMEAYKKDDRLDFSQLLLPHALAGQPCKFSPPKKSEKKSNEAVKPLSIGVFGPPGAGKSFGVSEIAKEVLGKNAVIRTFNLSQFNSLEELNGAFHQVRDDVLSGNIPLIFWDEFDSQNYRWLQYLLAPMQDGKFQERDVNHHIGKCIFVFAGAVSPTYETFGPPDYGRLSDAELDVLGLTRKEALRRAQDLAADFTLKKGPDFKTRLACYLNVLGPNQRNLGAHGVNANEKDPADQFFPIRRAFFIRSKFGLKEDDELHIDDGVLKALLEIPEYKAGSRSLEFLCQELKHVGGTCPGRSAVPGRHLLEMHVDSKAFWEICERYQLLLKYQTVLAKWFHEGYRIRSRLMKGKDDVDLYDDLNEDLQSANLAQALRIADNLNLIGLRVAEGDRIEKEDLRKPANKFENEDVIRKMINDNIELLGEAEHNGWMVARMVRGWRYSRFRDDGEKLHPSLIPYRQLDPEQQKFDKQSITGAPAKKPEDVQHGYIDLLKMVGLRIAIIKRSK